MCKETNRFTFSLYVDEIWEKAQREAVQAVAKAMSHKCYDEMFCRYSVRIAQNEPDISECFIDFLKKEGHGRIYPYDDLYSLGYQDIMPCDNPYFNLRYKCVQEACANVFVNMLKSYGITCHVAGP